MAVNKAIVIGNLGADPQVHALPSGQNVANLSLATNERFTDRNGDPQQRTEWHHIAIFSQQLAKVAFMYLRKGSRVYIEGQLQTRQWQDQNGQQRATTEIVLSRNRGELVMLDGRPAPAPAKAGHAGAARPRSIAAGIRQGRRLKSAPTP